MASNFSLIPFRWPLTVDSEMAFFFLFHSLAEVVLVFFSNSCGSRKNYCQTGEWQSKFHWKNRCRTHRFVIHAISVFSVKFTVEFTSWAMNFSIEESKENDLIIKASTGSIKTRKIRNLLFSLTLQAVRLNNQGAPLLGLAKSKYMLA